MEIVFVAKQRLEGYFKYVQSLVTFSNWTILCILSGILQSLFAKNLFFRISKKNIQIYSTLACFPGTIKNKKIFSHSVAKIIRRFIKFGDFYKWLRKCSWLPLSLNIKNFLQRSKKVTHLRKGCSNFCLLISESWRRYFVSRYFIELFVNFIEKRQPFCRMFGSLF